MTRQEIMATVVPLSRDVVRMTRRLEVISLELEQLAEDAEKNVMTVYDERQIELPITT